MRNVLIPLKSKLQRQATRRSSSTPVSPIVIPRDDSFDSISIASESINRREFEKGQTQRGCPGERQKWRVCVVPPEMESSERDGIMEGTIKAYFVPQWRDCDVITTRGPNMRNEEGLIKFEGKIFVFHQCSNYVFSLIAAFLPVRKRSIFNQSFFARDLYDRCVLCERYRKS